MTRKALSDLQQITVRPDWEAAEDSARTEAARRRLQFEIALLLYGIVTLGLSILGGGLPGRCSYTGLSFARSSWCCPCGLHLRYSQIGHGPSRALP